MIKFFRQKSREVLDQGKVRNAILSPMISLWYNYLPGVDHHKEVLFLNYGYANGEEIELHEADELNRLSIQLYHNTVRGIDLTSKKILEIGCGRGGGASYISRYFKPEFIIGMDRSKEEIKFNISHYRDQTLSFVKGNALAIPFPDDSFDVVLNVESSHLYVNFNKFLSEVKRVLKPGGYFLFTDFRLKNQIQSMFRSFEQSGLNILEKEDITGNIIQALDLDVKRRIELVKKLLPGILHPWALHYSGAKGSSFYTSFENGGRKYFYVLLRKPAETD